MGVFEQLRSQLRDKKPETFIPAGMRHYVRTNGVERAQIHLRVEADGSGVLLVNASRVYHLNPSACAMAYAYLEDQSAEKAAKMLSNAFQVSRQAVAYDIQRFFAYMDEISRPDGACPICDLELDTIPPFTKRPSAPYRMDLAITYRCNNACTHCYNQTPRRRQELDTEAWFRVLDQLWQVGIPHIVFTGGEPTLRSDLPQLISHAQKNGQITGINTNGRRLADAAYLDSLVNAGLDHVQITLESRDETIHDQMVAHMGAWRQTVAGIRNALGTRLFVMTNTTMLRTNRDTLETTLDFLAELGVPTVGMNALIYSGNGLTVGSGLPESELPRLLVIAREKTEKHGQRLIWYTPTQYCHFDPIQLGLGVKGCTAALYNMCIEPDGEVLPCQSYYQSLGNITSLPWRQIWEHELAVSLRERKGLDAACANCAALQECGGGCPLAKHACQSCHPETISALASSPW